MRWIQLLCLSLLHEIAPWRHSWAETSTLANRGPLTWTCRICGAVERELPG